MASFDKVFGLVRGWSTVAFNFEQASCIYWEILRVSSEELWVRPPTCRSGYDDPVSIDLVTLHAVRIVLISPRLTAGHTIAEFHLPSYRPFYIHTKTQCV